MIVLGSEQVATATFPSEGQGFNSDDIVSFLALVAAEYDKALSESADASSQLAELEPTRERIRETLPAAKAARQADRRSVAEAVKRVRSLEQERSKLLVKSQGSSVRWSGEVGSCRARRSPGGVGFGPNRGSS